VHVVPLIIGHTMSVGKPKVVAFSTCVLTETPKLSACVLHTQMTKLAELPGATCDVPSGWTSTQSCGGDGVVVVDGVGVGGVVVDGVGVGGVVVGGVVVDGVGVGDGTSAQVAEVVLAIAAESLAAVVSPSARPSVPNPRKASAVSAPIAAGLMISGLTRATPLRSAS
jgi:hypothetical protein